MLIKRVWLVVSHLHSSFAIDLHTQTEASLCLASSREWARSMVAKRAAKKDGQSLHDGGWKQGGRGNRGGRNKRW